MDGMLDGWMGGWVDAVKRERERQAMSLNFHLNGCQLHHKQHLNIYNIYRAAVITPVSL